MFSAVVLTRTSAEVALAVLDHAVRSLVDEHSFGFRGWGAPIRLLFENRRYTGEGGIEEVLSNENLDAEALARLHREHRWFSLSGSFVLPNVDRLLTLEAMLYPSFDEESPATVAYRLDPWLLESAWGADFDRFDADAAARLVRLSVMLGADPRVDGFCTSLTPTLADVRSTDAHALRAALVAPDLSPNGQRPGLVTGVKSSFVALEEIRRRWPDGVAFQTTSGFSVLSTLVADDEDDEDDEDDD